MSVGAGPTPPGQGAPGVVEDQFPLPAAVMVAALQNEPSNTTDMTVKDARICFVFIRFFRGLFCMGPNGAMRFKETLTDVFCYACLTSMTV